MSLVYDAVTQPIPWITRILFFLKNFFHSETFPVWKLSFRKEREGRLIGKENIMGERGSRDKDELGKNGRVIDITEWEEWEEEKKTIKYEK